MKEKLTRIANHYFIYIHDLFLWRMCWDFFCNLFAEHLMCAVVIS